jgi:hypothetical protein
MNTIKVGNIVKYKDSVYIAVRNENNLVLILGKKGDEWEKLNVSYKNLLVSPKPPLPQYIYRDNKFLVTEKGSIISLKTGSVMNWDRENGNRKAILKMAGMEVVELEYFYIERYAIDTLEDIKQAYNKDAIGKYVHRSDLTYEVNDKDPIGTVVTTDNENIFMLSDTEELCVRIRITYTKDSNGWMITKVEFPE